MKTKMTHTCGTEFARINGRTLMSGNKKNSESLPFHVVSSTRWIDVCPVCDRDSLRVDTGKLLPFLCSDSVMRTVGDFSGSDIKSSSKVIEFVGFKFTYSALESAVALQLMEFNTTETEIFSRNLGPVFSPLQAEEVSKRICFWGGGERVWSNLSRRNPETLALHIHQWFETLQNDLITDECALSGGIVINGLGVSFASKHLRMLRPDRFAVLDAVLSEGLGFALNLKGYKLFMHFLRILRADLKHNYEFDHDVATLEAGLFLLVRQTVRSQKND